MTNSTRKCRKCRNEFPIETLEKSSMGLVCKDNADCKWHTGGKARAATVETTTEPETVDTIETLPELPIDEYVLPEGIDGVVVTSAQNNTIVNADFWKTLTTYCTFNNFALVVIPYTYKATDDILARYEDMEYDVSYVSELRPYLCRNKLEYAGFVIHGDLNLRPTTLNPLSGVTSLTQGKDAVFGHPQICNTPLATAKNKPAIRMLTTGACTVKNYRQQPTGIKGAFHHSAGATLLLPNGHHYQLTATRDGGFIDRATEYSGYVINKKRACLSLVLGDIHVGYTSGHVMQETTKQIHAYQPENIFVHDLLDGNTINHHEDHNPFSKFGHNFLNIQNELKAVADFLHALSEQAPNSRIYVVASNHDDFLRRWLMRADWRELDKITAKVYLELASKTVLSSESNTLKLAIGHLVPDNVIFLDEDDSVVIGGVEHAMHGHLGANGGKGSPKTFAKHHSKSTTGHVHYASITRGNMTAGVSTGMDMGYNKGFSNWQNANVVLWENGKRQHLYIH